MGGINKNIKEYLHIDCIVAGICIISLVLLTVFGVIRRYALNNPITWLEEIQMALIVWCVFFGGSVAFRKRCHISIEIIVDALPKGVQKAVHMMIYIVTFAVLLFMAVQGFFYIINLAKIGRVTSVLQLPAQYIYAAFPLGATLMLLHFAKVEGMALLNRLPESDGEEDKL